VVEAGSTFERQLLFLGAHSDFRIHRPCQQQGS
jgi:hypothetical protein